MKPSQTLIGTTLGLVLLAGVGLALWKTTPQNGLDVNAPAASSLSGRSSPTPAEASRNSSFSPLPAAAPGADGDRAAAPVPWSSATPASQAAAQGAPRLSQSSRFDASKEAGGSQLSNEELQRRAAALTANGRQPSPAEVDQLLADIQRTQGKNEVGGVDLATLRENLAHASEIQRLALEIKQVAEQPGKPDVARIQALMAQIQQQQAGIRADVRVDASTPLANMTSAAAGKK